MRKIFKITAVLLIQFFLIGDCSWISNSVGFSAPRVLEANTLSPEVHMGDMGFLNSYLNFYSGQHLPGLERSIPDIAGLLKKLGFKNYDKFNRDFGLPILTKNGQLQMLIVLEDGKHAFAIRKHVDFYSLSQQDLTLNLIRINPSLEKNDIEEEIVGYKKFSIDKITNSAEAGFTKPHSYSINRAYRTNGLGSALLSPAVEYAYQEGMREFIINNPVGAVHPLLKKMGFKIKDPCTAVLDLTKDLKPKPDGSNSWRIKDVSKYRKFTFFDFRNKAEMDFSKEQNLLRKAEPGIKEIIKLLDEYKFERIITRYYLTGSFLKGGLKEGQDIDFSVVFRRYDNPKAFEYLLRKADEISKRSLFTFHITLEAFGYEYEFKNDRFIYTGLKRGEHILSRFEHPETKSILRLDNIESQLLNEEFFLNLYFLCKKFDFAKNNKKDSFRHEKLLNNKLINIFFQREEKKEYNNKFYPVIKKLIESDNEIIKQLIEEADSENEREIEKESLEILREFNENTANEYSLKVYSWGEFVKIDTMGEYDLTQFFSQNLGAADGFLQLIKNGVHSEKITEGLKRTFRKGYVSLKAIEIASRTDMPVADVEEIKKSIINNRLINIFFGREEKKGLKTYFYPRIKEFLQSKQLTIEKIINSVIDEVEAKGEDWIKAEGKKIFEEFNMKPVNELCEKVEDCNWQDFINIPTRGRYDLGQMLTHNLGIAIQDASTIKDLSLKDEDCELLKENMERNFREGYIILRAIEIVSRDVEQRTKISVIENVSVKEALKYPSMKSYILERLKQSKNITMSRELEPGKNSRIYIGIHPKFGEVLFKIVPYEIGINYGVEERFEIADHFGRKYNQLSPFPRVFEFISFEKIERAVIVEEIIEEFNREQMKEILRKERLNSREEIEKKLQLIEMRSLIKIWLESFYSNKYKGLVIRDIVPQDIRYVKINGEWAAKFIDLEERGFHQSFDDMLKFYSEMDYDYNPMMIIDVLASFLNQEEFAPVIKKVESSLKEKAADFIYGYKTMLSLFDPGDWEKEFRKMKESIERNLELKLKPLTGKQKLILRNEVEIQIKQSENFEAAVANSNLLIRNRTSGKKLLITLIPRMIPSSGRKDPSIKREKSFIYIGDKSYEIKNGSIIDKQASREFAFNRNHDGILEINLDSIIGNDELDAFLRENPSTQIHKHSQEIFKSSTLLIGQAI